MRVLAQVVVLPCVVLLAVCGQARAGRVVGEVTDIVGGRITATFPVAVKSNAMMIVLAGRGEAVAGMAIADKCTGSGPYEVSGKVSYIADASAIAVGKDVYVSSMNVVEVPRPRYISPAARPPAAARPARSADRDLCLYYYAAGQTVGYGAVGLGYERTIMISRTLGVEFDGGITGVGNVSAESPDVINSDQLIKSLNGRARLDFSRGFGVYTGYRWNQGRGDESHWDEVTKRLEDKEFVAPSTYDSCMVLLQGLEYGVTVRPFNLMALSVGYIPKYRVDYGTFGVRSEPAYTAELRFGGKSGAVRIRGIKSDDYWLADLGITIR